MDIEVDAYKLAALARDYRHAVRALSQKTQQIAELKASQEDAEKMLAKLEQDQSKAEKALWTYLRDI